MKNLTASDRSSLIKLASSLPKGDETRKAILSGLKTAVYMDPRTRHLEEMRLLREKRKSEEPAWLESYWKEFELVGGYAGGLRKAVGLGFIAGSKELEDQTLATKAKNWGVDLNKLLNERFRKKAIDDIRKATAFWDREEVAGPKWIALREALDIAYRAESAYASLQNKSPSESDVPKLNAMAQKLIRSFILVSVSLKNNFQGIPLTSIDPS